MGSIGCLLRCGDGAERDHCRGRNRGRRRLGAYAVFVARTGRGSLVVGKFMAQLILVSNIVAKLVLFTPALHIIYLPQPSQNSKFSPN